MTLDLIDLYAIVIWFSSFALVWHLIRPVLDDLDKHESTTTQTHKDQT